MTELTVALAGNPNCGKSTIFNALTGANQHVGNWPGKTVEKKEGLLQQAGLEIQIIDLPGAYSLSAYSLEEQITRDFIVKEKPNLIVAVVDAANLERNLYLATQILETGRPLLLVLNMMDMARQRGLQIDAGQLSRALGGLPVIPMAASRGQGLSDLREAIVRLVSPPGPARNGRSPAGGQRVISRACCQTGPDLSEKCGRLGLFFERVVRAGRMLANRLGRTITLAPIPESGEEVG